MTQYYAHTLAGRPTETWEPLHVHLNRVAALATTFAQAFGVADWGRVAGLSHDLGTYAFYRDDIRCEETRA